MYLADSWSLWHLNEKEQQFGSCKRKSHHSNCNLVQCHKHNCTVATRRTSYHSELATPYQRLALPKEMKYNTRGHPFQYWLGLTKLFPVSGSISHLKKMTRPPGLFSFVCLFVCLFVCFLLLFFFSFGNPSGKSQAAKFIVENEFWTQDYKMQSGTARVQKPG